MGAEFAAGSYSSTVSSSPVLIRMLVISMALSGAIAFATTADTVVPEGFDVQLGEHQTTADTVVPEGFDVQLDEHQDAGFDMVSESQNQPQPSTYEVVDESDSNFIEQTVQEDGFGGELLQPSTYEVVDESEELLQQKEGSGEEGSGEELLQQKEGSGEEGSGEELIQQEGEWGGSGEEGSGEELIQQEGEW